VRTCPTPDGTMNLDRIRWVNHGVQGTMVGASEMVTLCWITFGCITEAGMDHPPAAHLFVGIDTSPPPRLRLPGRCPLTRCSAPSPLPKPSMALWPSNSTYRPPRLPQQPP
jgi:hypothetical protein